MAYSESTTENLNTGNYGDSASYEIRDVETHPARNFPATAKTVQGFECELGPKHG